jgi:hypothetical protein
MNRERQREGDQSIWIQRDVPGRTDVLRHRSDVVHHDQHQYLVNWA